MQKRYWHFVEEMSVGSLQDNITTVNVPLLVRINFQITTHIQFVTKQNSQSAAYTIRFQPQVIKTGFNQFIRETGSTVFVTHTVDEFLFEGYSDPLLDVSQSIPPGLIDIPPYDKFGWFYGVSITNIFCYKGMDYNTTSIRSNQRNGSELFDGVFNVFTGVDDISKLDMMDMWSYMRKTKYGSRSQWWSLTTKRFCSI